MSSCGEDQFCESDAPCKKKVKKELFHSHCGAEFLHKHVGDDIVVKTVNPDTKEESEHFIYKGHKDHHWHLNVSEEGEGADKLRQDDADPIILLHDIHWLVCIETYKEVRDETIGRDHQWSLVEEEEEIVVYQKNHRHCIMRGSTPPEKAHLIVGFRGTKVLRDIHDDIHITFGQDFERGEKGKNFVKMLKTKYVDAQIDVTGHSLGGAIARVTGEEHDIQVVTFNAAAPPTAPVKVRPDDVNYHIMYDIVSAWQSPNTIRIDKGYFPHIVASVLTHTFLGNPVPLHFIAEMLRTHELANFSSKRSGRLVTPSEETQKFSMWFHSMNTPARLIILSTFLGTNFNRDMLVTGFPICE